MVDPVGDDNSGGKSGSIPEKKVGFMVAASPLNPVKLELGGILILGFFLYIFIVFTVDSQLAQIFYLGAYGVCSMVWIIHRARKLILELKQEV